MLHALDSMAAGFADLPRHSQQVFRTSLMALSYPGRWQQVPVDLVPPAGVQPASALLLLALLDADTRLWVSPSISASAAADWLRFHTGCPLTGDAAQAHFVWCHADDALPALHTLQHGSLEYPDQSATLVLDMQADEDMLPTQWQGPGIQGDVTVQLPERLQDLLQARQADDVAYPLGVDVFIGCEYRLLGLPRTTVVSGHEMVEV